MVLNRKVWECQIHLCCKTFVWVLISTANVRGFLKGRCLKSSYMFSSFVFLGFFARTLQLLGACRESVKNLEIISLI